MAKTPRRRTAPKIGAKPKPAAGAPRATKAPAVVVSDDELVARTVSYINDEAQQSIEAGSKALLRIGRRILKDFFGGDPERARSRARANPSFRRLADHRDLQLSASGLHNAVALVIQEKELKGAGVKIPRAVTVSHRILLLRLQSLSEKRKLIDVVAKKRLSVRQLQIRIAKLQLKSAGADGANGSGGGSSQPLGVPRFVKSLTSYRVDRWLDPADLAKATPRQLEETRSELREAVQVLKAMIAVLDGSRRR